MKRTIFASTIIILLLALLSFSKPQFSTISGKVTPAAYAVNAWAISKTDTLYTTVENGSFEFYNAKPGSYKLIIGAQSPYKHTVKDHVVITAGENVDVGELSLEKYVTVIK